MSSDCKNYRNRHNFLFNILRLILNNWLYVFGVLALYALFRVNSCEFCYHRNVAGGFSLGFGLTAGHLKKL